MRRIRKIMGDIDIDTFDVVGIIFFVFFGLFFLLKDNKFGGFYLGISIFSCIAIVIDYRKFKRMECKEIVEKLRFHPDKSLEEAVAEAIAGATYWNFRTVWKKLRNSHDYGRIFTGIFR